MKYIIFGAGKFGKLALDFLGHPRVDCFVDNYKAGTKYFEKEVIGFESLLCKNLENFVIVIAVENYWKEIETQLKKYHIHRYFCFDRRHLELWTQILPNYYLNKQFELVSYNRILSAHSISGYERIVILGANEMVPYLISEIAFQGKIDSICGVITLDEKEYPTIGIHCSGWEDAPKNFDCLMINCPRHQPGLDAVLEQVRDDVDIIDLYDVDCLEPSFWHPELKKYKDIHKGKRIFILGNGPSLRIEDLSKLHNEKEICIGVNKVYKIYNDTAWRADYLCFSDFRVIIDCQEDFECLPGEKIVGDVYHFEGRIEKEIKENLYERIHVHYEDFFPGKPRFSNDITKGTYIGHTVIYDIALQLAAYMGAESIYLLGVDHNFTDDLFDDKNHFIKDYCKSKVKDLYKGAHAKLEESTLAFKAAELYSRKNGFRIYNATRGGKLEVFERVDFEQLFDK